MTKTNKRESTVERALADPSAVFESPEAVLRATDLSEEDKLSVLERWEDDARLLQVATEENMGTADGGEGGALLQRVHDALAGLGSSPKTRPSPTKSG